MFMKTGELIIFAIRAGLKLGQQARTAYTEATINRELELPLPNFNPKPEIGAADTYFSSSGKGHLDKIPRLKKLYEKSLKGEALMAEEKEEYLDYYREFKREDDIRSGLVKGDELGLTPEALISIVKVRQWARGKSPFPSAYQRMLGTLIEVGIEYFSKNGDLLDVRSAKGRALKGFLNSIDDLDFASGDIDFLARELFVAAIEAVEENPALLGADEASEKLVEAIARGLVKDVKKHVAGLGGVDLARKDQIYDWAQVILRSVIASSGDVVLQNPRMYLGLDEAGEVALVTSVGRSVLDLLVENETLNFRNFFTRKSIDKIVEAALHVLTEYPSLAGIDNKGLEKIFSQVVTELADSLHSLGFEDILPELICLILEKTAENAALVWPDGFNDPAKHLLIVGVKEFLEQFAKSIEDDNGWKINFTRQQLIEVLEVVLDKLVRNPQWLIEIADSKDRCLGIVVGSVINALKEVPLNRVTPSTVRSILEEVIITVARRKDFLAELEIDGRTASALEMILDTVVNSVLSDKVPPDARWALAREGVFELIVELALERLEREGISEKSIVELRKILDKAVKRISSGESWDVSNLIDDLTLPMNGGENAA